MPIHLEPKDIHGELEQFDSVLIVSCPVCPAMSLAMQQDKPLFNFFRHGIKTPVFEDYIDSIRKPLQERGIRTSVFTTRFPTPMMCIWTQGQRNRLRASAQGFQAIVVLGCRSANKTVKQVLEGMNCAIFDGMRMKSIANATMKIEFPAKVRLQAQASKSNRDDNSQPNQHR